MFYILDVYKRQAKALVELSNNLPNSGGIVSWFTGDNDTASFGEQLVSFGQSFAAYYNSCLLYTSRCV